MSTSASHALSSSPVESVELATTLKQQTVSNRVREVGINEDYWYPVAWSKQLKPGKILSARIWQKSIVLYRTEGQVQALENVCPHKGVALDRGKVKGDRLICAYHGWQFNAEGHCTNIPYLPAEQKLPCAQVQSYPVQEKYGLIWLFPGNASLADTQPLPDIPEYDQPDWLMIPVDAHFNAHFSICNENTMDVFHGYLHQNLQGWFDPVLLKLRETENAVMAEYNVSYKGMITKFLRLSEKSNHVTTQTVSIAYRYPHYHNSLQGISSLYLMRLPLGAQESRSFTFLFVKVRLSQWLIRSFRPILRSMIRRLLFLRFLVQDIEMIESEQQHYLANPQRRYVEINPAIIAVQRLIVRQYDQFLNQKSSHSKQREESWLE